MLGPEWNHSLSHPLHRPQQIKELAVLDVWRRENVLGKLTGCYLKMV